MIKPACETKVKDSIIKISEKRSRHATILNKEKSEFRKIAYDGCCKINETACDWIVVKQDVGTLAIELKGSDIDHACDQIIKTFNDIKSDKTLPEKLAALIVCTRVPRVDTKLQRAKLKLAMNYKAPLTVKEDARNLVFSDLFKF
jgi:hypothetical protein